MNKIFLLLLFTNILSAQFTYVGDSTWIVGYKELSKIREKIIICKEEQHNLQTEIEILTNIKEEQASKISKLRKRDSLYAQEIELYKAVDITLRKVNDRSLEIINTQRLMISTSEERIKSVQQEVKKERLYKNVFKWGYPALVVIVGVIKIFVIDK